MSNITKAFKNAKARENGVLIGYIMAGDPALQVPQKLLMH